MPLSEKKKPELINQILQEISEAIHLAGKKSKTTTLDKLLPVKREDFGVRLTPEAISASLSLKDTLDQAAESKKKDAYKSLVWG